MKLVITLWITAVLVQEVVPSVLVRVPRQAPTRGSSVHTEYEAKYEQRGRHGNESFSTVKGKQEITHDSCGDTWHDFADKCANLIKDLIASLANAVSSQPGDATNLQLQIKNNFRHFDSTDNCTCLNQTAKAFSDLDLSSLLNNITFQTVPPPKSGDNNSGPQGNDQSSTCAEGDGNCNKKGNGGNQGPRHLNNLTGVNPEHEDSHNGPNNNTRRKVDGPSPSGNSNNGNQPTSNPFFVTPIPVAYSTSPVPSPSHPDDHDSNPLQPTPAAFVMPNGKSRTTLPPPAFTNPGITSSSSGDNGHGTPPSITLIDKDHSAPHSNLHNDGANTIPPQTISPVNNSGHPGNNDEPNSGNPFTTRVVPSENGNQAPENSDVGDDKDCTTTPSPVDLPVQNGAPQSGNSGGNNATPLPYGAQGYGNPPNSASQLGETQYTTPAVLPVQNGEGGNSSPHGDDCNECTTLPPPSVFPVQSETPQPENNGANNATPLPANGGQENSPNGAPQSGNSGANGATPLPNGTQGYGNPPYSASQLGGPQNTPTVASPVQNGDDGSNSPHGDDCNECTTPPPPAFLPVHHDDDGTSGSPQLEPQNGGSPSTPVLPVVTASPDGTGDNYSHGTSAGSGNSPPVVLPMQTTAPDSGTSPQSGNGNGYTTVPPHIVYPVPNGAQDSEGPPQNGNGNGASPTTPSVAGPLNNGPPGNGGDGNGDSPTTISPIVVIPVGNQSPSENGSDGDDGGCDISTTVTPLVQTTNNGSNNNVQDDGVPQNTPSSVAPGNGNGGNTYSSPSPLPVTTAANSGSPGLGHHGTSTTRPIILPIKQPYHDPLQSDSHTLNGEEPNHVTDAPTGDGSGYDEDPGKGDHETVPAPGDKNSPQSGVNLPNDALPVTLPVQSGNDGDNNSPQIDNTPQSGLVTSSPSTTPVTAVPVQNENQGPENSDGGDDKDCTTTPSPVDLPVQNGAPQSGNSGANGATPLPNGAQGYGNPPNSASQLGETQNTPTVASPSPVQNGDDGNNSPHGDDCNECTTLPAPSVFPVQSETPQPENNGANNATPLPANGGQENSPNGAPQSGNSGANGATPLPNGTQGYGNPPYSASQLGGPQNTPTVASPVQNGDDGSNSPHGDDCNECTTPPPPAFLPVHHDDDGTSGSPQLEPQNGGSPSTPVLPVVTASPDGTGDNYSHGTSAGSGNSPPVVLPMQTTAPDSGTSPQSGNGNGYTTVPPHIVYPVPNGAQDSEGSPQTGNGNGASPTTPSVAGPLNNGPPGNGGDGNGDSPTTISPIVVIPVGNQSPSENGSDGDDGGCDSSTTLSPVIQTTDNGNNDNLQYDGVLQSTPSSVAPGQNDDSSSPQSESGQNNSPVVLATKDSHQSQFTTLGIQPVYVHEPTTPCPETQSEPTHTTLSGSLSDQADDDSQLKPTTFQTTSQDPTPASVNLNHSTPGITRPISHTSFTPQDFTGTSSQSPNTDNHHDDDDLEDEDEECCSCESCTEEAINPKEFRQTACKDIEDARRELKAIFDKIQKRLKCGRKTAKPVIR